MKNHQSNTNTFTFFLPNNNPVQIPNADKLSNEELAKTINLARDKVNPNAPTFAFIPAQSGHASVMAELAKLSMNSNQSMDLSEEDQGSPSLKK